MEQLSTMRNVANDILRELLLDEIQEKGDPGRILIAEQNPNFNDYVLNCCKEKAKEKKDEATEAFPEIAARYCIRLLVADGYIIANEDNRWPKLTDKGFSFIITGGYLLAWSQKNYDESIRKIANTTMLVTVLALLVAVLTVIFAYFDIHKIPTKPLNATTTIITK